MIAACGAPTPPLSYAPSKDLVESALQRQLQFPQTELANKLQIEVPNYAVSHLKIEDLTPLYLDELATFHLRGHYDLAITGVNAERPIRQKKNPFDLYLQRQQEGKTWRLLRLETSSGDSESHWASYLIAPKES